VLSFLTDASPVGKRPRPSSPRSPGWSLDAFDFFIFVFLPEIDQAAEFHTDVKSVAEGIFLTLGVADPSGRWYSAGWRRNYGPPAEFLMLNVASYSAGAACHRFRTQPRDPAGGCVRCSASRWAGSGGVGAALALETLPRTGGAALFSGLLQEGYVIGYLLAVARVLRTSSFHVGLARGMFIIWRGAGAAGACIIRVGRRGIPGPGRRASRRSAPPGPPAIWAAVKNLNFPTLALSGLADGLLQCLLAWARRICIRTFSASAATAFSAAADRQHRHRHEPGPPLAGGICFGCVVRGAWGPQARNHAGRGARPCR